MSHRRTHHRAAAQAACLPLLLRCQSCHLEVLVPVVVAAEVIVMILVILCPVMSLWVLVFVQTHKFLNYLMHCLLSYMQDQQIFHVQVIVLQNAQSV